MLYQTIIDNVDNQLLTKGHGKPLVDAINHAGRFVFDENSTRALSQLALTKPSRILLAQDFLKLPFDWMWVEYIDAQRKALWIEKGGEIQPDQLQPIKTGILAWRDAERENIISIWSAWTLPDNVTQFPNQPFHFSPLSVELDLSFRSASEQEIQQVINIIHQNASIFFAPHSHFFRLKGYPEEIKAYATIVANSKVNSCPLLGDQIIARMSSQLVTKTMLDNAMESWREDITQEIPFIIASILLLNCRNGVTHEPVNYKKLNKKRNQKGKRPILDHTVVRLRVPRGSMGTGGGTYERRSAHWVMGHPKVRKTGVFWWSPHVRGEDSDGKVTNKTRHVKA